MVPMGMPLTAATLLGRNINGVGHKSCAGFIDREQRCDVGRLRRQVSELNAGTFGDVEGNGS